MRYYLLTNGKFTTNYKKAVQDVIDNTNDMFVQYWNYLPKGKQLEV